MINIDSTNRELIVVNYIEGYNNFEVPKMCVNLNKDIVFESIQNGEITMSLKGIEAFQQQAEQVKSYFSFRKQTVKSFIHSESKTEIEIEYYAVLAMDFPNGLKTGDELVLEGKSIFEFQNGEIIRLTDIC